MQFVHGIESVLTIIIMCLAGFLMTRAGWLDDKTSGVFAKIILNLSLPAFMIYNLLSSFSRKSMIELSGGLIVPLLSVAINYLMAIGVSNLLHVRPGRKGIFRSVFFASNTIFIGLPVNLALFGDKSVPDVLLYYIANTLFFWTFGASEIARDGGKSGPKIRPLDVLKKILSPTLISFAAGVALTLLGVRLPAFLMDSAKYLGNLTTPLAMLFIGIVLYGVNFKALRIDRDLIILSLARFVVAPLTILVLERFIPLPPLMMKVFVIQAAMPAMTNTGVVAREYGADVEFATLTVAVTTLLSLIFIPLYMLIL